MAKKAQAGPGRGMDGQGEREELPLSQAAKHLLEECRMVLPGMQALFGFQLTVVFSPGFDQKLNSTERVMHLLATALMAVGVALIMTPAAYHRQTSPREVTERFLSVSTRVLLWSMLPLSAAVCLDFYLIGRVITDDVAGGLLASGLFGIFLFFWFVLPRVQSLQQLVGGDHGQA